MGASSTSFKKGIKPKGKPKGSVNKVLNNARELFVATLENQVPFIEKAFADVREKNPAYYLELFAKYAQYFIPKKVEADISVKEFPAPQIILNK